MSGTALNTFAIFERGEHLSNMYDFGKLIKIFGTKPYFVGLTFSVIQN